MKLAERSWLPSMVPALADEDVERLAAYVGRGELLILTGAGCSTESGIPDYRGPITGRQPRSPLTWQQFSRDEYSRRRYWSRAMRGWLAFRGARPGRAHHALASLSRAGFLTGVVTQNVDGLHHRAGARSAIELHGSLARVECRGCGANHDRDWLQGELERLNPEWVKTSREERLAPDGDADVGGGDLNGFRIVDCPACGGLLKPGVVMFGENVPPEVKAAAMDLSQLSSALLVVGSSLSVYSGYRFVHWASRDGKPSALVNLGPPARGVEHLDWHIDGLAGEALARCCSVLGVELTTGG